DYRNYDYSNTNILIKFGDFARNGKDVRMTKPLKYQYIFPEPDMITSGSIMYSSQQKIKEVIDNRGIIVQAEDINVKNKGRSRGIHKCYYFRSDDCIFVRYIR
uniref:hypothetical protein n=1 Tax=Bacteroides sp. 14(A) TaxID=1163670 RepID=UPI0005C56FEC